MSVLLGLLSKFAAPVVGVLLVALLALFGYHRLTVALLEHNLKELNNTSNEFKLDNLALRAQVKSIGQTMRMQNDKLRELILTGEQRSKEANVAIEHARAKVIERKVAYDRIINLAPPAGLDDCKATTTLFNNYFDARRKEVTP